MKTPSERKSENEKYLIKHGIPINKYLPIIESEEDTELRKTSEIVKRILILSYLNMLIEGVEREEIVKFLKQSSLWEECSPNEIEMLERGDFTEQEKINISWQSEAMWIMLWSIKKVDNLKLPTSQCEIQHIVELLPGYLELFDKFTEEAELRSKSEILDKSDLIYRLHWATRQASLNKEKMPAKLEDGIIQEWHYAINWITNYEELDWDYITTDT